MYCINIDESLTRDNFDEKGYSFGTIVSNLYQLTEAEKFGFTTGCVLGAKFYHKGEIVYDYLIPKELVDKPIGELLPIDKDITRENSVSQGYVLKISLGINLPFYDLFEQSADVWEEGMRIGHTYDVLDFYIKSIQPYK